MSDERLPRSRARRSSTTVSSPAGRIATANDDNVLESVAVVAGIFEELAVAPNAMGVSELARALGQSKARIHRNLASLRRFGLVDQEQATERYRLGWKLFQLGERASVQFNLRQLADPFLKRLRDLTGQSALLAVPLNGEALVIATADNDASVSITVKPGNRPTPHCSTQGRIALAWASEVQRERLLGRRLAAKTTRSMTDAASVRRRLAQIRERLYEEAPDEVLIGINTLSAPVLRDGDELVGIIGIIGSTQDVPSPPDARQLAFVQGAASAMSDLLQGQAYRERGIKPGKEIAAALRHRS